MAIYEFFCESCRLKFEQITSMNSPDAGQCPKCGGKNTRKLISSFAVGGQGDLRESTMHGCHDCPVSPSNGGGSRSGGCGAGGCGHSH